MSLEERLLEEAYLYSLIECEKLGDNLTKPCQYGLTFTDMKNKVEMTKFLEKNYEEKH